MSRAFRADRADTVWFAEVPVELFVVAEHGDSTRFPLVHVPAGGVFFGMPPAGGHALLAVPLADAELRSASLPEAREELLDEHVARLSAATGVLPEMKADLAEFSRRSMQAAAERAASTRAREDAELQARYQYEVGSVKEAVRQLASVVSVGGAGGPLRVEPAAPSLDTLVRTCEVLGEAQGIRFRRPPPSSGWQKNDPVVEIAHASRVLVREVRLEGPWWQSEGASLLGFAGEGENVHPVALLALPGGRYRLVDLVSGRDTRVDGQIASELRPVAYQFYRALPERSLRPGELFFWIRRTSRSDVARIGLAGMLSAALACTIPVGTSFLIGKAIPHGLERQVVNVGLWLVLATLGAAVYQFARTVAMLRLEGRVDSDLQGAVMGRLLTLRPEFFRRYTSGDLGQRVLAFNDIRELVTGSNLEALMGAVFSVFSFAVMFYYAPDLAFLASLLTLGMFAVLVWTGTILVSRGHRIADLEGELSSTVLQLLKAISKIRVAGAEGRAFAQWASRYAEQRRLELQNRTIQASLAALRGAFPVFTTFCFFAVLSARGFEHTSSSGFLAFFTAFGQFQGAILGFAGAISSLLNILPLARRARPIVTAELEVGENRPDPGVLEGSLKLEGVSFRYQADGPHVLRGVTIVAHPGEFVAVVGPSGAGKSTLLRLLLGFERPEQGSVLYDGQDLAHVDVQAVRRQIGTVLQDGKLMVGDIFHNIVGNTLFSVEDAWEAARLAGIEDDIRALPMGMHTILMEDAAAFSGGQRQRLMLARAIVGKPRYLFLDEATSALDAVVQARVTHNLEQLKTTRVVIAHRLSTIRKADRIYVMVDGRVAQVGTFEELVNQSGPFADLARRQMI